MTAKSLGKSDVPEAELDEEPPSEGDGIALGVLSTDFASRLAISS